MPASTSFRALMAGLLAVIGGCWLLAAPTVAAQGRSHLSGRVFEEESGRPLDGARVTLRRAGLTAVTNAQGRFLFPRVSSGVDTLDVAYIGRQAQSREVTLTGQPLAGIDFELPVSVVQLAEVQVLGVMAKNQAEALNRQKNAANITNVVASDQMGRFPDASAPEAVQRLPGVAVARDQGEGRYIQIRGGSAANTQVTFNGNEVPSPEGEARQIALDAVPVDVLESIEVAKAITPDMDGDAIGGAVNLVTRQAPDVPTFSAELAGGYATIRQEPAISGALTYGRRFADDRLGLLVSASGSRRDFGSDGIEPEYDLGDPGLEDDELEALDTRHYTLWRARLGATAALDWRVGDYSDISLTGIYSELQDDENRRRVVHAIEDGEISFGHKNRYEAMKLFNLALAGDHLLPGGIGLDYDLTYSRSSEREDYDWEAEFVQGDVAFAPDISDPDNIQTNPAPGTVTGGSYEFDNIVTGGDNTRNRDLTGAVALTVPYRLGRQANGRFKFGGKIRDKDKDQDVTEIDNELLDDAASIVLGSDIGAPFDYGSDFNPGAYEFPRASTSDDDVTELPTRFGSSLEGELNLEAQTNDYDLDERVTAVFAMTELDLTEDLLLLPGVRYEHTKFTSTGFEFDPEAETLTPLTAERSYDNILPMVHVRYRLTPQTNLRAAYTTTLARPNFFDLVPFRLRDDEDLVLGNPDLEATTSRNFDLLLEHYDRRIGVLSAGAFYKRLNDPIFLFTEENAFGGATSQPRNVESAEIRGFEVAVQQQLSMLPTPLDGLGIWANYTYTDSEATLPGGRTARLAGQAAHVFNTALSYEKGGFSGQVSLNYNDPFVLEFGSDVVGAEERGEDIFLDSHLQFDATGAFRFTPSTSLFLELVNLTNEPFRTYQGSSVRPRQEEYYESWGRIGVRYTH
jgi:TonB-dependent receptor